VGGDAAFDSLHEARTDFHESLMRNVLTPVDAWREQLRVVEVRGGARGACGWWGRVGGGRGRSFYL